LTPRKRKSNSRSKPPNRCPPRKKTRPSRPRWSCVTFDCRLCVQFPHDSHTRRAVALVLPRRMRR
jgi:hypothetical protein